MLINKQRSKRLYLGYLQNSRWNWPISGRRGPQGGLASLCKIIGLKQE